MASGDVLLTATRLTLSGNKLVFGSYENETLDDKYCDFTSSLNGGTATLDGQEIPVNLVVSGTILGLGVPIPDVYPFKEYDIVITEH